MGSTTRGAFPFPDGTANWKQLRADLTALAQAAADKTSLFVESTAAARPAPATFGRFHRATDTGALSLDTGTAWVSVPTALVGQAYDSARLGGISAPLYLLTSDANAAYQRLDGPRSTGVGAQESTTSGTYVDLATVGPAETVTVGPSGRVKVTVSAEISNSAAGVFGRISWAVSGATTVAANDGYALLIGGTMSTNASRTMVLRGLAQGPTTFTAKYRQAGGGTATFGSRDLIVEPL